MQGSPNPNSPQHSNPNQSQIQNKINDFLSNYLNANIPLAMKMYDELVNNDPLLAQHLVQYTPPSNSNGKSMKHASILILKDYIKQYYDSKHFSVDRNTLRQSIFNNMINCQDDFIQKGWATCIAQIGKVDYPVQWPNLISLLEQTIKNPSSPHYAVRGSISTLIISTELWSATSLPNFLKEIHELLLFIVKNNSFSPDLRFKPIRLLSTILELLFYVSDEYPKFIEQYIPTLLTSWFPIITTLLPSPDPTKIQDPNIDWSIVNSLVEILSNLLVWFPKCLQSTGFGRTNIPQTIWRHLDAGSELYSQLYIIQGSCVTPTPNPIFPGTRSDYESFLQICVDFCVRLLDIPRFANWIAPSSGNNGLQNLIKHCLTYSQLTKKHISLFYNNPPEFLDLIESTCVRTASFDLIQGLIDRFGKPALTLFIAQTSNNTKSLALQFFEKGPREAEAVVSLVTALSGPLSLVQKTISASPSRNGNPNSPSHAAPIFEVDSFLALVAEKCLNPSVPYLMYSAFNCAKHFSDVISPKVASMYITPVLGCLDPKNKAPWILRYAATLLLSMLAPKYPPNSFNNSLFQHIITQVLALFPVPDEAIYSVFPALINLIQFKPNVIPTIFPQLSSVVSTVWNKYADEGVITETVEDVFQVLLSAPETHEMAVKEFVPMLTNQINIYINKAKSNSPISGSTITAAEFALESLLLFTNPPNPTIFENVVPTAIQLCLFSPHRDIYCAAATLLRDLVWLAPEQPLSSHNVLQSLESIISHLLSPKYFNFSNQAANEVFDLLFLVARKFPSHFRPLVGKYIQLTLTPLYSTWVIKKASDTMLSAFLPFYGYLVKSMGPEQFIKTVSQLQLPPPPPNADPIRKAQFTLPLEFMLSTWTTSHASIAGSFRNKLSLLGLFELLKYIASKPAQFNFKIEGELCSSFEEYSNSAAQKPKTMQTRSKAASRNYNLDQRRAIPPAIGILKVLFSEWNRTLVDKESEVARQHEQAKSVALLLGESVPDADLSYVYDDDDDYFADDLTMFGDDDNLQSMLDEGMEYEEKRVLLYTSEKETFDLEIDSALESFLSGFLKESSNKSYMDSFIPEFNPLEKRAVNYFFQQK